MFSGIEQVIFLIPFHEILGGEYGYYSWSWLSQFTNTIQAGRMTHYFKTKPRSGIFTTAPLYKKHGVKLVGTWLSIPGDSMITVTKSSLPIHCRCLRHVSSWQRDITRYWTSPLAIISLSSRTQSTIVACHFFNSDSSAFQPSVFSCYSTGTLDPSWSQHIPTCTGNHLLRVLNWRLFIEYEWWLDMAQE